MSTDRKELKRPDAVLKSLREGFEWSQGHLTVLVIISIAVFVVAACWIGVSYYRSAKEEKALLSYNEANRKFNQKFQEISKTKKDNTAEELKSELNEINEVSETYPKTQASLMANFQLGDFYLEQKKYPEAQWAYERTLKGGVHPFYRVLIYHSLGYLFEASGQYPKAIEYFEKITTMQKKRILFWVFGYRPNAFWVTSALFGIGRCYEKMSRWGDAKEIYTRIENQFAQTAFADRAQALSSLLSSKTP